MTVVPFGRRAVAVDWSGLEGALTFRSDEASHYFDTRTGQVHLVQSSLIAGGEGDPALSDEGIATRCAAGELIPIEPLPSSTEYEWMAEFADGVKDADLAEQLRRALEGKRPFRRFKDALASHPDERDRFHRHHRDRVWEEMRAWIEENGIQLRSAEVAKITYDRGMCDRLPPAPEELTRSKWEEPYIPEAILWSLEREGILDLAETWGDRDVGDPVQVDIILNPWAGNTHRHHVLQPRGHPAPGELRRGATHSSLLLHSGPDASGSLSCASDGEACEAHSTSPGGGEGLLDAPDTSRPVPREREQWGSARRARENG